MNSAKTRIGLLWVYARDDRMDAEDNNIAESVLFFGSGQVVGGGRLCRLNYVDPESYRYCVLEIIADWQVNRVIERYTPQNLQITRYCIVSQKHTVARM